MLLRDDILTVDEVAVILKVSRKTVYKLARENNIPCVKIGSSWRFHRDSLEKYIKGYNLEAVVD